MTTISYTEARRRLAGLLDAVEETGEPVVLTRQGHANVVLMSEDEFSSLQETAHLLRSPGNARRLVDALREANAGHAKEMTIKEVFNR